MAAVKCTNFDFGCPCDSQDGNPESFCCAECVMQPCVTRKHIFRAQAAVQNSKPNTNAASGSGSGGQSTSSKPSSNVSKERGSAAGVGGVGAATGGQKVKDPPSMAISALPAAAPPPQQQPSPPSQRQSSPLLHPQAQKLLTLSFPTLTSGNRSLASMTVDDLDRIPGFTLEELPWPSTESLGSLMKELQPSVASGQSGANSLEPVGVLLQRSLTQGDLMVITRDSTGLVRLCTAGHNHEYGNPVLVQDRLRRTEPVVVRSWVLRQGSPRNNRLAASSPEKPALAGRTDAPTAMLKQRVRDSSVPCCNRPKGCPCDSQDGNPESYCCGDCLHEPCSVRLHYQASPPPQLEGERTPPAESLLLAGGTAAKNITGIELPVPPLGIDLKDFATRIQQIQKMEKEHAAMVAPASVAPLDEKTKTMALEKKREITRLKLNLQKEMSDCLGRFTVFMSEAEKTEKELKTARGCEDRLEPRWRATREIVERRFRETTDALREAEKRVAEEKARFHSWNALRPRAPAVPKKTTSKNFTSSSGDQLATLFGGYFQFVFAGEIQPGKQKLECKICFDVFLQEDRFYTDCCGDKVICRTCALRHIQTELERCSTIIRCPWNESCSEVWPKSKCTEVMGEREIGQWDRVEWRQTSQVEGAVICRAADCRGLLFNDDLVFQDEPHHFICPVKPEDNAHHWCLACDAPWHEGSTCKKYQEWRQLNDNAEAETKKALAIMGAKECHQCHNFVEKKELCNHMTCLCGAHFCNVCGEKLDPNNLNDHYGVEGKPCYGLLFAGMYDDIQ